MWVKCKLVSVYLEIVLITAPDGCMVCAECTMGVEIILGTPDGTPRCVGQVEGHFGLFGNVLI
jgi:hypothetical protein